MLSVTDCNARGRAQSSSGIVTRSRNARMDKPTVRLHRWDEIALEKVTEMISRKIVTGEREMLAQIYLKRGALVPMHSHESEQMTYILQGALKFLIDGEELPSAKAKCSTSRRGCRTKPKRWKILSSSTSSARFGKIGSTGPTATFTRRAEALRAQASGPRAPAVLKGRTLWPEALGPGTLGVQHRSAIGGDRRQWRAVAARHQRGRRSDGGAERQARWGADSGATLTRLEIRGEPKRGQGRTHKPPRLARSTAAPRTGPHWRSGRSDRRRTEESLQVIGLQPPKQSKLVAKAVASR